jgi:hypothetical protein
LIASLALLLMTFPGAGAGWTRTEETRAREEAAVAWDEYREGGSFGVTRTDRSLQVLWLSHVLPGETAHFYNERLAKEWITRLLRDWKGDGTALSGYAVDPVVASLTRYLPVTMEVIRQSPLWSRLPRETHLASFWTSTPEAIQAALSIRFSDPNGSFATGGEFLAVADELFRRRSDEAGTKRGKASSEGVERLIRQGWVSLPALRKRAADRLWRTYSQHGSFQGEADAATLEILWKDHVQPAVRVDYPSSGPSLEKGWVALLLRVDPLPRPWGADPLAETIRLLPRTTVRHVEQALMMASLSTAESHTRKTVAEMLERMTATQERREAVLSALVPSDILPAEALFDLWVSQKAPREGDLRGVFALWKRGMAPANYRNQDVMAGWFGKVWKNNPGSEEGRVAAGIIAEMNGNNVRWIPSLVGRIQSFQSLYSQQPRTVKDWYRITRRTVGKIGKR